MTTIDADERLRLVDDLVALVTGEEPSAGRIVQLLGRHFGGECRLLDSGFRLVAGTAPRDPEGFRRRVRQAADTTAVVALDQGLLVLDTGEPLNDERRVDLHRAARLAGLGLRRRDELARAHAQLRGELLDELLAARGPLPPGVSALAGLRGFDLDTPYVVVCVRTRDARAVTDVAALLEGLGGRHGDASVAVLPGDDPVAIGHRVAQRLRARRHAPVAICVSDPVLPRRDGLAAAAAAAAHGAELLAALGVDDRVVTAHDLVVYRKLFDAERAGELRTFALGTLEPLLSHDRDHRGDLLRTVRVLMANNGNATRAARELYIHPNTMGKRLDRIGRLLGPDWQSGPFNLHLRLALHLLELGADMDRAA
ncbi:helix-turn-helix domain-containing protein [Actinoplanes sp. NPDC048796]|uniref:PucR family transcriptional regulator n=1 Tax=unclassified Actinoplanes TaxID=2626549 RepID=UPI0033CDE988